MSRLQGRMPGLTLVFLPALYVAWFRIAQPQPQTTAEEGSEPALQAAA
jgi:hypothetical protein